ncbi:MAG: phenylalanine--tRNA ligase subunit alpha [Legionellales bacterium]|nr:phenylalanine--tRNA ligase subunit alpha [Legionellales bacterium]
MVDVSRLLKEALSECDSCSDLVSLDKIRVKYLGKKGELTALLKQLGELPATQRPIIGQEINSAKTKLLSYISDNKEKLAQQLLQKNIAGQTIDVSLPGRGNTIGTIHPVNLTLAKIEEFFVGLGFDISEGPEVESSDYNFTHLNIPEYHPARAMHDTFYFDEDLLLRTHTSPVQIRAMEQAKPPFRLIAPGKVYRCDSDLTHTPMFHQVEGFYVDKNVSFVDLRTILLDFFKYFFERELTLRMRPSYFPFTEPSAEVDISCVKCDGEGCRICSHTGWIEVLGCGMIHPNVLIGVNVDPETYMGWAFGLGIDRLAMLKYSVDDLRAFFDGDIRFLEQFTRD